MPLTGNPGVEDRDASGQFLAVFTFDSPVTAGDASIVSGTAAISGSPIFAGNEMRLRLTGVANQQVVTIRVSNINGNSGSADVDFGFLIGDANGNGTVDKPDFNEVKAQVGQPVTNANFRDDVIPDGTIGQDDGGRVKAHKGESLP